jgi:ABC-type branched-subunit amino acid transport system substrate-binding protein
LFLYGSNKNAEKNCRRSKMKSSKKRVSKEKSYRIGLPSKGFLAVLLLLIILASGCQTITGSVVEKKTDIIKIGLIDDLSGISASTGQSAVAGAEIARKELQVEGINVDFIYEDYQMDSKKALLAARKLIDIDDVDALYVEFTPAAAAIAPTLKDTNLTMMCAVGSTSILNYSEDIYKVFIDFEESCEELAQYLKNKGYEKPGYLKYNWEAGSLCENGLRKVYGDNLLVEGYGVQDLDLSTQVLKLKKAKVDVVINPALESSNIMTYKAMETLDFNVQYATIMTAITDQVTKLYPNLVSKTIVVSVKLNDDIMGKLAAEEKSSGKKIAHKYNAAFAYMHIKQMAYAIKECGEDTFCIREKIISSPKDESTGFNSFQGRIARYDLEIVDLSIQKS